MKTKLLSALMAVISMTFLGVTSASAAAFDVQVRGHLTRPQMFCPSGATLCGTAYIEGYGNAEYGWFLFDISGPSGSCGPHSGLYDYKALIRLTLPDGSTLTLQEVGTLCSAGNSYPTGGLNSYGNPLFFDAYWQVVSATGQFSGLIGNGTSRGTFAGAAVDIRYGGTLNVGSNEATIRLSWDILRNGAPATCEEVGASNLRLTLRGSGSTMETEFDCNQKSAEVITSAGTYTVEIELVDSAGTSLSLVPIVSTVELFIGDVYFLGDYYFSFAF
jgi:hypothetical protein